MLGVVILAAGQGTRMRSETPKVLHPLCGRPMVLYALDAVRGLSDLPPVLVVGHGAEEVRRAVGEAVTYVEQREQRGTGHAVLQARPALKGRADEVLILYADMPLLTGETLRRVVDARRSARAALSILTVVAEDPRGFGRVVRQADGSVARIVEEADATEAERAIRELNAGVYACDAAWLWAHLPALPLSRKGEYYLTDLVEMAAQEGQQVGAGATDDPKEALGITSRLPLARERAPIWRPLCRSCWGGVAGAGVPAGGPCGPRRPDGGPGHQPPRPSGRGGGPDAPPHQPPLDGGRGDHDRPGDHVH